MSYTLVSSSSLLTWENSLWGGNAQDCPQTRASSCWEESDDVVDDVDNDVHDDGDGDDAECDVPVPGIPGTGNF